MKFEENKKSDIFCPICSPAPRLIVKTNRFTGKQFLGCPNFPECTYKQNIPEEWIMRQLGQKSLFDVLGKKENE